MNIRTCIFVASLALPCVAPADGLQHFDEVRQQYQMYGDGTRLSYLYNRCAALELNVAALLVRKGQKQGAADFENLAQHYMMLSEANEREIDKKRGLKSKETMKVVNRAVSYLSEIYSKRMKQNFVQRGDYLIGDIQLEQELKECNLPEQFKKAAQP
jgi:hypothetical protein